MKTTESKFNSPRLLTLLLLLPSLFLGLVGCKDNARLADHDVRAREVQSITAYGKVLDKDASPVDVAYVFLKAVLDDYEAGGDLEKREAAFNTQLGVFATEKIKQNVSHKNFNEQQQLEAYYSVVRRFAPVVGHYRESFKGDYETLTGRMYAREYGQGSGSPRAVVLVNLDHPDPKKRPGGNVVARLDLVRERGFWRIWWVSFSNTTRDWKEEVSRRSSKAGGPIRSAPQKDPHPASTKAEPGSSE
ncbi:MAG: hypothetical protein GXP29_01635 [Planctomycetes bacterium]|nr:hypothetical protein [Planctomycetota bacterium]